MINDQELVFIVDENNNPLAPLPRKGIHENRIWHRVTHIWVVNSAKEILVQKRSLAKDLDPGKWESFFGGHLAPGDTEIDCAVTELEEETGLKAKPEDLKYFKIYKCDDVTEFQSIFVYSWNGNADQISYEKEEIDEVKWMPIQELRKQILAKTPNLVSRGYELEMFDWIDKNL
jgi:isopentenyldiphosphate isomerase